MKSRILVLIEREGKAFRLVEPEMGTASWERWDGHDLMGGDRWVGCRWIGSREDDLFLLCTAVTQSIIQGKELLVAEALKASK